MIVQYGKLKKITKSSIDYMCPLHVNNSEFNSQKLQFRYWCSTDGKVLIYFCFDMDMAITIHNQIIIISILLSRTSTLLSTANR